MSTYQEERFPVPTPWRLVRELRLRRPPWWMVVLLVVVVVATWIPLAWIGAVRGTLFSQGRIHFIQDMDRQPRFGPQTAHPWFADGRAARMPIDQTVPRGPERLDDHYRRGYREATDEGGQSHIDFFDGFPAGVVVDQSLIERGRDRFDIYCALCHGPLGTGDGMIHQRAVALGESAWVPPTNLASAQTRQMRDGQLFQAISDGIRNMPGYAGQIETRDRWAIVAFVRHLQETLPVAETGEE